MPKLEWSLFSMPKLEGSLSKPPSNGLSLQDHLMANAKTSKLVQRKEVSLSKILMFDKNKRFNLDSKLKHCKFTIHPGFE